MKKINITIIIIVSILSLFRVINELDNSMGVILKDLSIILTLPAPYIFEKAFKKNLDEGFKFIWIIFIFMAHFLGVINEFYAKYYYFDKITHTISGLLSAYVAVLITGKKTNSTSLSILFIISFSALCAVSWEIFEFVCKIIFGGDAQRVALTGVDDTMLDIIVALTGSICFSLYHYFKRTSWRSFTFKT